MWDKDSAPRNFQNFYDDIASKVGDVVSIEKVPDSHCTMGTFLRIITIKYNIFECKNRFYIYKLCLPFFFELKLIIQQKLIDY